jgi:hypothetical protein
MNIDGIEIEIPEEINVHKQIWGKNAEEEKMRIDAPYVTQELMNLDIVLPEVI